VLEHLVEDVGATVHFSVADGDESVSVVVVEPRSSSYHLAYHPGSRHPLSVGALGRALTAAAKGERGTFTSANEVIPGATGITAAVPGIPGLPGTIGAVTLNEFRGTNVAERLDQAVEELLESLELRGVIS
jgi:hypothetical protein